MWMWGLASALQATTDPLELCAHADAIAVVEVTSAETEWAEGGDGHLLTRTWASVLQVLDGKVDVDTVELLAWGGSRDGLTERVEDQALLHIDHRYVLLLSRDGASWRVTGGEHGAWSLPHGTAPILPEGCHVAR
jgi:hypothetical protein